MMLKKIVGIIVIGLVINACSNQSGASVDMDGFEQENIPGTDAVYVTKRSPSGELLETGILRNGTKDGVWVTYYEGNKIKSINSYVNGHLNGLELTLNERGQMETRRGYMNGEFHGLISKYDFGRIEEDMTYKNGVIDGPFKVYTNRGKVQKEGAFKNGNQHGLLKYYDDEGNLIMQYEYNNGEKVGGGMIENNQEKE